jgi:predicted acylesterase/phospholipase RssA
MAPEQRAPATPAEVHSAPDPAAPLRLGLALSGGGFRATIFHLGVLIRLAELDLLRHLHVISSVSGGSILAAHYMLRLKISLEASATGRLSRDEYVALVGQLRAELRDALARQLRCRLLDGPLATLRMLLLGWTRGRLTLSDRMASLYQRHLFASATRAVRGATAADIANGMPLSRMRIRLPALEHAHDLERFNASGAGDHVPKLVLNAATLNTGCKFTFTFSEVGDEMLGFVRFDERELLAGYKQMLRGYRPGPDIRQAARDAVRVTETARPAVRSGTLPGDGTVADLERRPHTAEHLAWWAAAHAERAARRELPGRSEELVQRSLRDRLAGAVPDRAVFRSAAVQHLLASPADSARFLEAPLGPLRTAKLAAWYVLDRDGWSAGAGPGPARRGGYTLDEHRARFWQAIRDMDPGLAARVPVREDDADWMEFVIELYYFRVAEDLYDGQAREITLPAAVQASANFPPVFGPLELRGLYDKSRVRRLCLSDGGLNDNNGIETLLDERCTHIIASEAGPGPAIAPDVGGNRFGMMETIVLNQLTIVRRLQLRTLREQARVHEELAAVPAQQPSPCASGALASLRSRYPVEAIAFFQIDSRLSDGIPESETPAPLAPHPLAPEIVRLRTDLDGFARIEQDALIYQGYQYCDRFVRRYLYGEFVARGLVPAVPPAPAPPAPLPATHAGWDRAKSVLAAGAGMFGRAMRIRRAWWFAWLPAVAALAAVGLGAGWLAWAGLGGFVRSAHVLTPAVRWGIRCVVCIGFDAWLVLSLFGSWVRLDGLFAGLAARGPAEATTAGARRLS